MITFGQMSPTISIETRFCGPPDSGNGGYVCGLLASFFFSPECFCAQRTPPLDCHYCCHWSCGLNEYLEIKGIPGYGKD